MESQQQNTNFSTLSKHVFNNPKHSSLSSLSLKHLQKRQKRPKSRNADITLTNNLKIAKQTPENNIFQIKIQNALIKGTNSSQF